MSLPWLVEQVRELQAENQRLRAVHQAIHECRDDPAKAIVDADRIAGAHIVRAADAEAERDAAREQVRQRDEVIERVRALADEFAGTHGATEAYCADRIRAALDGER